jgi:hypothetical protein
MIYADEMPPAVAAIPISLILIAAVAGVAMMALFRLASRPAAIRRVKRSVQAHLLELRLFGDEPALIWKAQIGLLAANARYLAAMLLPIAVAAAPFTLAFPYLQRAYGEIPAPVGSETVVTAKLRRGIEADSMPRLIAPVGMRVESAAVRIPAAHEVVWRVRIVGPVADAPRLDGEGAVERVEMPGRAARYPLGPVALPWEAWFAMVSITAALLVKKRLGVVF